MSYDTTYHRDGTVTVWDVYRQQWTRRQASELALDNDVMPTLSGAERERVSAMARGMTVRQYRRVLAAKPAAALVAANCD